MVNGVKMVPGATPNVKGDYGNGFVKATVSEGMPDVEMNVDGDYELQSGQKARVKEKFPEEKQEERIKEIKENYKRLIKN
ncbi:MAG: hypothetical protein KGY70_15890 [Bacteroidales bacterium]|nr:hypothetical protein [Bacteroidales bacterium]